RAPRARRSSPPPTGATCGCAAWTTTPRRSSPGPGGSAPSPGSRPSCSSSTRRAIRSAGRRSSASWPFARAEEETMDAFLNDLGHGVRLLVRRPGFTTVAVLSLALGIGLNTTLFSVVNAVLLRKTPVADPDRLVEIYSSVSPEIPHFVSSYPDYLSILEGTDAFAGIAGHAFVRGILSTGGKPVLTTGEVVTANYFDVLGITPALGRGFRPDENVGE